MGGMGNIVYCTDGWVMISSRNPKSQLVRYSNRETMGNDNKQ